MWRHVFVGAKRRAYRNTIFLTEEDGHHGVRQMLESGSPCPELLFTYVPRREKSLAACSPARLRKLPSLLPQQAEFVHEYCASSVTRILDLMAKMHYTWIAFLGIDLHSPGHFYSSYPELGKTRFDAVATKIMDRQYGPEHHATSGRGLHHFLGRFFAEQRALRALNLVPSSRLANMSSILTIAVGNLVVACTRFSTESNREECIKLDAAKRVAEVRRVGAPPAGSRAS